jgi:hypothetical protein
MTHRTVTPLATLLALLGTGAPSPARAQAALERVTTPTRVTGVVFDDRNGDGVRGPDEPGLAGVAVTDQVLVVTTDAQGAFVLDAGGYGLVSVDQPDGWEVIGPFWRTATGSTARVSFPLRRAEPAQGFTFVHASDTHVSEASVSRLRRLRQMVDTLRPAFVLITGDLVRDALRVNEEEASGYYRMFVEEIAAFSAPVYTVPGNHEKFGIERHSSLVSSDDPLYGNRMYRSFLGPDYYAFTYGGVRFLGLNSVDYDDLWYHGHVDSVQVAWIRAELERAPLNEPVVTFNHIPFVSGGEARGGYEEAGPAPSVIRIDGVPHFRHTVYNHEEILTVIGGRLEIALAGHIHMRESIEYRTQAGVQRLHQAAAIVGPGPGQASPYGPLSGFTLYRVEGGHVDDGTFVPLDPQ